MKCVARFALFLVRMGTLWARSLSNHKYLTHCSMLVPISLESGPQEVDPLVTEFRLNATDTAPLRSRHNWACG